MTALQSRPAKLGIPTPYHQAESAKPTQLNRAHALLRSFPEEAESGTVFNTPPVFDLLRVPFPRSLLHKTSRGGRVNTTAL